MKYLTVTLKETKTRRVHVDDLAKLVASGAQIVSVTNGQGTVHTVRVGRHAGRRHNESTIRVERPPQFKAKTKGIQTKKAAQAKAKNRGLRAGSIGESVFRMFLAAPNKRFTNQEIETKLKALKSKSLPSAMVNNIKQTLKKSILRDEDTGTYHLNPAFRAQA
jgi:hypothetical protein